MKKTTLVIMAAGIGSRFGGGIKQLAPVGPNGEIIMDYSIHDALEAGFNRVVFIIRRDLEEDFKEIIGNRIEKITEVAYAYQELTNLPKGFTCPADRKKPWGTGHAILCCKDIVDTPFAVINADDYYGKEGFKKLHEFLAADEQGADGISRYCMAGFLLGNTLSENGSVTRGICHMDEMGYLTDVTETFDIYKLPDGAGTANGNGGYDPLDPNILCSMNMWGFTPDIFETLEAGFSEFLSGIPEGNIKAEYLLPSVVDGKIKAGKATVAVLKTQDKWFGVTYKEDKPFVVESFRKLIDAGVYRTPLF